MPDERSISQRVEALEAAVDRLSEMLMALSQPMDLMYDEAHEAREERQGRRREQGPPE